MSTDTKTVKYEFRPGITRETTPYAAEGGWFDGNRVRFRDGKPQNIRGWQKRNTSTFIGTAREITTWSSLDSVKYVALGTQHKVYLETGGTFYDITPIVSTVSVSACFNTSAGSFDVIVSLTAHNIQQDSYIEIENATTVGGNVYFNGDYQVSVVDTNSFEITYVSAAAETSASAGNATINYRLPSGGSNSTGGSGYNAGRYGGLDAGVSVRAWNVPATTTNIEIDLRKWTFSPFGEDLLINDYPEGKIYRWDESNGTGVEAVIVSAAPTVSNGVIVSPIDRHVLSLGSTDLTGTFDPLLVRWSAQENYDDWTPSVGNTSGDVRLSSGSEIRCAINYSNQILIWTDKSLHGMQFVGSPLVFSSTQLGDNCGIISRTAAAELDGRAFWMGEGNFFMYAGQVNILPCTVRSFIFDDFNFDQKEKVFAGVNSEFEEVTWLYPSAESEECNRYVSFSPSQNYWTYGDAIWTVWEDANVFDNVLTAGVSVSIGETPPNYAYLYNNEPNGVYTADGALLTSFVESGEFDIGDGDDIMYIDRIIPDFVVSVGTLDVSLITKTHPSSEEITKGPFVVNNTTTQLRPRARGRTAKLRIATSTAQTKWKFGTVRMDMMADGKR